jgi:hypothetical protein
MFLPIQMLPQRSGFQSVVLHAFAPFLPFLRLHHIILDASFLNPAVHIESEGALRQCSLFPHEAAKSKFLSFWEFPSCLPPPRSALFVKFVHLERRGRARCDAHKNAGVLPSAQ